MIIMHLCSLLARLIYKNIKKITKTISTKFRMTKIKNKSKKKSKKSKKQKKSQKIIETSENLLFIDVDALKSIKLLLILKKN